MCFPQTRQLIEELTELPVMVELSSDFLDRSTPIFRDDVAFFISQSGKSTLCAVALSVCMEVMQWQKDVLHQQFEREQQPDNHGMECQMCQCAWYCESLHQSSSHALWHKCPIEHTMYMYSILHVSREISFLLYRRNCRYIECTALLQSARSSSCWHNEHCGKYN